MVAELLRVKYVSNDFDFVVHKQIIRLMLVSHIVKFCISFFLHAGTPTSISLIRSRLFVVVCTVYTVLKDDITVIDRL